MRAMRSVLSFQLHTYIRGSRYVMPAMALVLFVALFYAIAPVQVVDSIALSVTVVFFIMVWVGLAYTDTEDAVTEQLLTLKLHSGVRYQTCVCAFLALAGGAFAAFAMAFPLGNDFVRGLSGGSLYKTPMTLSAALWGLLLHGAAAWMGAATGAFFHPRIMRERKIALLVAMFVAVTGFVRPGILREAPVARFVLWLFPPISQVSSVLTGQAAFAPGEALYLAGIMMAYALAVSAVKVVWLAKKKFP